MHEHDWLDGVFGSARCANCGTVYGDRAIAVIGHRDDHWFARCTCQTCGTQALGVVIVKEAEMPRPTLVADDAFRADALRVDDVLEAHELLRSYVGDAHGLFERVSGH